MKHNTHIFDLDGTLLKYHTNEWLPGALERLRKLHNAGCRIIFMTMRGPQDDGTEWSVAKTHDLLRRYGLAGHTILFSVPPGRVLYDDTPPKAVHKKTNDSWENVEWVQ